LTGRQKPTHTLMQSGALPSKVILTLNSTHD
jgi:hypothetical protein